METEMRSRVVLIPCDTYEEETVYERLKEGVALLGGMEQFVKPEDKVLLKPNLVRKAELSRAVVTHPAVMGAVARLVREAGVKTVTAGDSCGFGEATAAAAEVGMDQILQKYEVPVVDFSGAGLIPYEAGVQAKGFYLCREVLEADALINVCKMKTHALERVTGAVKNLYGCIYGLHKAKGHTCFPGADSFAASAHRPESVCKAAACHYGRNHCHGRERAHLRGPDPHEGTAGVGRSGGTGQRLLFV